jgi:hypothetical protein
MDKKGNPSSYVMGLDNVMNENQLMFCYKGGFSQEMLRAILSMTTKKMNEYEDDTVLKKKVTEVLIGCFQNISTSSFMIDTEESLLTIRKINGVYEIFSGKVILKNRMDQLKQLFTSIISSETAEQLEHFDNNSLIEIALMTSAKKTDNKIEYHFKDINETTAFLSLKIGVI